MSTFNEIDLECENCGQEFRGTVWVAVHAGVDPKLKELLLGGELNLVSCPECAHVTFQNQFLIYQEPAAELIAYVYPESQRSQEKDLQIMMDNGFKEAQAILPAKEMLAYNPVLLFGLESLAEMLREEGALAEQSQIAAAHCKENNVPIKLLSPSQARRLGTMRVLPYTGRASTPSRSDILSGIDRLLKIDPVLDFYSELRETIQKNPEWSLMKGD